jgi:hypothetical protein
MPGDITITSIAYEGLVTVPQIVTVSHKVASDPDTSFIVDTTNQAVTINGQFDPALTISGLFFDTHYTVMVANSCGNGLVAYLTIKTDANPCPDISQVYGTVY